jgi:hypothetical protein
MAAGGGRGNDHPAADVANPGWVRYPGEGLMELYEIPHSICLPPKVVHEVERTRSDG